MVGVGGSNPLSRTNSKKHLKKKHYLLLITRSKGRWFESTQSYQFKKNVGRLSGEAAPPDIGKTP